MNTKFHYDNEEKLWYRVSIEQFETYDYLPVYELSDREDYLSSPVYSTYSGRHYSFIAAVNLFKQKL